MCCQCRAPVCLLVTTTRPLRAPCWDPGGSDGGLSLVYVLPHPGSDVPPVGLLFSIVLEHEAINIGSIFIFMHAVTKLSPIWMSSEYKAPTTPQRKDLLKDMAAILFLYLFLLDILRSNWVYFVFLINMQGLKDIHVHFYLFFRFLFKRALYAQSKYCLP